MKRQRPLFAGMMLALLTLALPGIALAVPNPVVQYTGKQNYMAGGQPFTRYNLTVVNRAAYPNAMFAPSPQLPPCGLNKNSARTWVDVFNRLGPTRLYGFCALRSSADLAALWFAKPVGQPHPQWVFIVMTDRLTNMKYKSVPVHIP
jgi:hypothetical protein